MTPTQYRAAIKRLGLSQHRAAEFFGVSPRTSQGYALGEYPVPAAIAKLLRLMTKLGLKPEDVQ
jgi:transcriptional regulator with XRE-family HTH domain